MIVEQWVISLMILIVIPLVLSWHQKQFEIGGFLCSLALVLFYNIWTGMLDTWLIIFPVLILGMMLMGFGSASDE